MRERVLSPSGQRSFSAVGHGARHAQIGCPQPTARYGAQAPAAYQPGDDRCVDGADARVRGGRRPRVLGPLHRCRGHHRTHFADERRQSRRAAPPHITASAGAPDDRAEARRQAPPREPRRLGVDDDLRSADHHSRRSQSRLRRRRTQAGRDHRRASPAERLAVRRWSALGTTAVLWAPAIRIEAAVAAAAHEIAAINAAANRFDPASELSQINAAGGGAARSRRTRWMRCDWRSTPPN